MDGAFEGVPEFLPLMQGLTVMLARWPEHTFSPVRASTGQWVLKNGGPMGPLSYLEEFCVTQKNWQDFGEWRLERSKKLEVRTRLILSKFTEIDKQFSNICEPIALL